MKFVTTLTNNYVPAVIALFQSMKENAKIPFSFIVVMYDEITPENLRRVESVGVECQWVAAKSLGEMPILPTQTPRMTPNFQKPLIWNLPFDEAMVYVDSDILCLNTLAGIEAWDELTVVPRQSRIAPNLNDLSVYHPWNAGVMGFRPSQERLRGIYEQAITYTEPLRFGDQIILNDYFEKHRECVRFASMAWNMSTRVSHVNPGLFSREPIRFLHFAHDEKPWSDPIGKTWQRRFWFQWQSFYNRGVKNSLGKTSVFLSVPNRFSIRPAPLAGKTALEVADLPLRGAEFPVPELVELQPMTLRSVGERQIEVTSEWGSKWTAPEEHAAPPESAAPAPEASDQNTV